MTFRDYQPRRPTTQFVNCPECQTMFPRDLITAVGPTRCGVCGERFLIRNGAGVVRLMTPVVHVPPQAAPPPPASSPDQPRKMFLRTASDAHGSVSTSIRTSETEKADWKAAADAAGLSYNGYLRRALAEAVALDKANTAHPEHEPASRSTPTEGT